MAAALEAWRMIGIQRNHQWTGRRDHRSQRLLIELAARPTGVMGEVVLSLAPHLGLPRSDQVHGTCDRAHQTSCLRNRYMQNLADAKRRVHSPCKPQPERGSVSGAGLPPQR